VTAELITYAVIFCIIGAVCGAALTVWMLEGWPSGKD
jgi:predicted permease